MEILHFKDLGDTESVVTNAVVLVLGECQISIKKVPQGVSTLSLNIIVSQPRRGSIKQPLRGSTNKHARGLETETGII